MSTRPPVTDWLTDWDHLDPRWNQNPFPIWEEIRQSKCPIAHTERFHGVYLPTKYKDVRDIAYDPEHFSSRRVIVRDIQADAPPQPRVPAPPITSDPPDHRAARMVLLPPFTPQAIDKLVPKTRALCNALIDKFIDKGSFDGAADYAQHIPVAVIAHMLGIPERDGDQFRLWIHNILEVGITDYTVLNRTAEEMAGYFLKQVELRKRTPGDDLISYLLTAKYPDGQPFTEEHVLGSLRLLLIAGIDTTWSGIGSSIWHLATHAQDREKLVQDPASIPTAIEEFLRAYAPVTMARLVVKEQTVNGCPFNEGQMVLLSFPAANRDPAMFPDADKVIIDRQENRHAAFGLGIHRCVGSNLARMEMTVAVEELLKRIPKFSLEGETKWSEGTVRGPRQMTLKIG